MQNDPGTARRIRSESRAAVARAGRLALALAALGLVRATVAPGIASAEDVQRGPPAAIPLRAAVEHILFLHSGSFEPRGSTRSRAEAVDLAGKTARDIREGKVPFDEACRRLSEDESSKKRSGFIGIFTRGELSNDFEPIEKVVFPLAIDEVSEPVETPLGVHVFRRVRIREWSGSHILFQWKGTRNAPASLERTRDEALALARAALEDARKPGADFADLARRRSEAPDRAQGGSLGIFTRGEVLVPLEEALDAIQAGEVTGPVETDLGFHVVKREPIRRVRAAHVLIRFKGCIDSEDVPRSREEALAAAGRILAEARAAGADFSALARKHSEDGTARQGGEVGLFTPGQMDPAFEKAAFALEVGAVSDIVETAHGFHIIRRLPED
jgi:peptidyl-prolyl cis-trans isomerase SurA